MSLALGAGVGITHAPSNATFALSSLSGLRLLLDARTIAGSHGDALATLSDASGLGNDFTQAMGANQPTLSTSWAGSKAIATSGTQWATLGNGLLTGVTSFSFAWVGAFSSVTGARVAFNVGNNAADGFDFDANRNSAGKFGLWASTISANDTTTAADTDAHVFIVTYDAARTPKWTVEMDGVALTLAFPSLAFTDPTTRCVLGAVNAAGAFGMAGNTGLFVVCSGVWTAPTRSAVRANARASWTGLPA